MGEGMILSSHSGTVLYSLRLSSILNDYQLICKILFSKWVALSRMISLQAHYWWASVKFFRVHRPLKEFNKSFGYSSQGYVQTKRFWVQLQGIFKPLSSIYTPQVMNPNFKFWSHSSDSPAELRPLSVPITFLAPFLPWWERCPTWFAQHIQLLPRGSSRRVAGPEHSSHLIWFRNQFQCGCVDVFYTS